MRLATLSLGLLTAGAATAMSIHPRNESLDFDAYRALVLQPDHIQELWKGVSQHIDLVLPGIQCSLADAEGNYTVDASLASIRSDYCGALENELGSMFPTIRCYGDLDLEAYLANDTASAEPNLQSRATNPVIEADDTSDKDKANTKVKSFISSCSGATHPGNCRACAIAYGAAAVSEIGVCAAAAYAAMASTAGIATPAVVAGMTTCGAHAITTLFANINGCWTR
ncbi:putative hit domain containing protein [Neofusicoccum parvum UCRNP2]|uniref:Putative hit domain containing protein n=1 Tax=Botryosphaeria parva (strain UCR-NP2) TaxID=1287680 RepID=R1GU35_BOTPV|nr:putative hit domain containing protein [Neofusicoccum parvum UCRNP2]